MRQSVKERDMAGMAAFELALQYSLVRQDRSYHFLQLLTAIFSLIFFVELVLVITLSVLLPLVPVIPPGPFSGIREYASPPVAIISLVILLLIRASKHRFVVEPGDAMAERLNREVLEPCLGIKLDTESGKLYSDQRQVDTTKGAETFYSLRYSSTAA